MGSEQHYSLRWNDYTVKIVTAFQSLRDEEDFVDVTVACDGHSYSAHKMVLSACSPYFRALLRANPCQHPIVILKDVGHVELERLLEFMYNGEVSIAQDQLAAFLKTAENLKIRGLAGSSDDLDQAGIHRPDVSYSYSGGGATSGRSSPSAGYAPSQGSKDDDIAGEGGGGGGGGVSGGGGGGGGGSSSYHTRPDSPPAKRRKRSSAPASSHTDPNTTTHTSEGVGEALVEGIEGGGSLSSAGLPGDDELRLDRREMKSEPGDSLTEVYSESSDMSTDPHSHSGEGMDHRQPVLYPIAMAGPSGSVGSQDGVGTHEPGGLDDLGLAVPSTQSCHSPPLAAFTGTFPWPQPQQQGGGGGAGASENQCVFCFKSFSNRGSMTRHLRDQHLQPGATVTCDICGKVCKNRNCLITHRSVAHAGRRRHRGPIDAPPWPPHDKGLLPPMPPLHLPPHHQA